MKDEQRLWWAIAVVLVASVCIIAVGIWGVANAQVPLIGDNGIVANAVAGCPAWPGSQGVQFPVSTWDNPTSTTIYITGFSVILETANNVMSVDMWASIYRRSDMSRLYNALHEFMRGTSYRANDQREFGPNYYVLGPGDALLLEGGCVAYDTHPAADAGLVLNVTYATQQPGATPTPAPTATPTAIPPPPPPMQTPTPQVTPTPAATPTAPPMPPIVKKR